MKFTTKHAKLVHDKYEQNKAGSQYLVPWRHLFDALNEVIPNQELLIDEDRAAVDRLRRSGLPALYKDVRRLLEVIDRIAPNSQEK